MDPEVLIFESTQAAAEARGDRTLVLLEQARKERGVATLALSGGNTPRLMFQSMTKCRFDWTGTSCSRWMSGARRWTLR